MKRHGTVGIVAALVAMAASVRGGAETAPPAATTPTLERFIMNNLQGEGPTFYAPSLWRPRYRGKPTPRRVKHRNPKHAKRRARHARKARRR